MKKQVKTIIRISTWVLIIISLVVSCYQVYSHYSDEKKQTEQLDKLTSLVETPDSLNSDRQPDSPQPIMTAYEAYAKLFVQNTDMVGWIHIDGTSINYPVIRRQTVQVIISNTALTKCTVTSAFRLCPKPVTLTPAITLLYSVIILKVARCLVLWKAISPKTSAYLTQLSILISYIEEKSIIV